MLLSADSFNRADSTTNLGTTDGAGTLDPLTWVQRLGTWGINSNEVYTSSAVTDSKATVDLGVSNFDIGVEVTTSNAQGLCFRYVDNNNYWYFIIEGTASTLNRIVAGAHTLVSGSGGGGVGPLRVIADGPTIRCFRNDRLTHSTVDSAHVTATNHGLYNKAFTTNRMDGWFARTPSANNFLPFFV